MDETIEHIPLFPLMLLPLPGELIPLHIFEPRYRQLLSDMETHDISFGIYCNHELNNERIGAIMKLESVLKRYATGESDIVVKCSGTFSLKKMNRLYPSKLYPGGDVTMWEKKNDQPGVELYGLFIEYQKKRKISRHFALFDLPQIAAELNLDLHDRYKFLMATPEKATHLLVNQLKLNLHVLDQEEKTKNQFFLN